MRKSGEGYRVRGNLENTDRITRDTFWIGVYPEMTYEMGEYMINPVLAEQYWRCPRIFLNVLYQEI